MKQCDYKNHSKNLVSENSFQTTPRTDLLQNGLVGSPCSSRDSQESSPTPQFKLHSTLSLLRGPTFTSEHNYWKNHSFDQTDLCQQSNVSAFQYTVQICHSLSSKEHVSFNFIATVTICRFLKAPKMKSVTVSTFSPSVCYEVMELYAMILVF